MAEIYAHSRTVPEGELKLHLDIICHCWHLRSATRCVPRLVAPDGEAETWSPKFVFLLADLARCTFEASRRKTAKQELLKVWRLRLRRYPGSNPDLIAQDVKTVLTRHVFLGREWSDTWPEGAYEAAIPRTDICPHPPEWEGSERKLSHDEVGKEDARRSKRKRDEKGKGPANHPARHPRGVKDRAVLVVPPMNRELERRGFGTFGPTGYAEMEELPPIPGDLTPIQKLLALRQREAVEAEDLVYVESLVRQKKKARDLARTRYEVTIHPAAAGNIQLRQ